ncbi:unnamed protein product [Trichobilharzia szidati]|nr:unnamed protein product [Trichobilharzia szidati]
MDHQNTVITEQPNTVTTTKQEGRDWTNGLFQCTDNCSLCWLVACCFPCYLCYMYKLSNESCWLPVFGSGPMYLRIKHRFRHSIKGTLLNDWCVSTFCSCCTTCQLKKDMDYIKSLGEEI